MAAAHSERRDALVERMRGATLGALDIVSVYIGVRLGLYRTLADRGPSSSAELAEAAGLNERYVREWLGAMVKRRGRRAETCERASARRNPGPGRHVTSGTRATRRYCHSEGW